jgi:lysophospholipase L1-like esterase
MKHVLCFGDSNTWGWDPEATALAGFPVRHGVGIRWTGVLQAALGSGFRVIEEGLNGRTTVFEDPIEAGRNGSTYLDPCLWSHMPLDLVVVMLGTNDLKTRFSLPPGDIADGASKLLRMIQRSETGPDRSTPKILLLAPPPVGDLEGMPELAEKFKGANVKSKQLPGFLERAALQAGVHFLDTQKVVRPSPLDGLHLSADEHGKLGRAVVEAVVRIFTR